MSKFERVFDLLNKFGKRQKQEYTVILSRKNTACMGNKVVVSSKDAQRDRRKSLPKEGQRKRYETR